MVNNIKSSLSFVFLSLISKLFVPVVCAYSYNKQNWSTLISSIYSIYSNLPTCTAIFSLDHRLSNGVKSIQRLNCSVKNIDFCVLLVICVLISIFRYIWPHSNMCKYSSMGTRFGVKYSATFIFYEYSQEALDTCKTAQKHSWFY